MATETPRLIAFGISHYCEKARWALDWHGIPFNEVGWPPGLHVMLARRLGTGDTSLPILLAGDAVVQGSGRIIDWAERNGARDRDSLAPHGDISTAAEIERRADNVIGVEARRLLYAEMFPGHADMVKPALFQNTGPFHRLLGNLMWPKTRRIIRRIYAATPDSAAKARARLEAEFDWLETELADGRQFLVGDRFSRVDLTVASLLGFFVRPPQVPAYHNMDLPPTLAEDIARWRPRPVMHWVGGIYETCRGPAA